MSLNNQMDSCQSLNINNITRSSTFAYLDYRNRMQNRLANLNNNVSSMIKESFSGIDDICQRVRECLYTVNVPERQKAVSFSEETTEYEIVEEISKSGDETAHDNELVTDMSEEKMDHREDIPPIEECCDKNSEENVNIISCNDQGDSNINEFNEKSYMEEISPYEDLAPLSEVESMTESKYNVLEKFKETVLSNVVNTYYDDFDVMDKIIENINEEIKDFSQATISGRVDANDPAQQKTRIKRPILNPRFKKPPPIRRPSTESSRISNLRAGTILSENELDCLLYNKRPNEPFIMPDVYRKRAFTNLYQRLMLQLEANDSLVLFQKLMNRNKQRHKKMQKSFYNPNSKLLDIPIMNYYPKKSKSISNLLDQSKKTELSKKYNDSLWFSQLKGKTRVKTPASKRNIRKKTDSQRGIKTPINYSVKSFIHKRKTKRSASNQTGSNKSSKGNSASSVDGKRCPLECPCKMVVHNDKPLTPSTKCRLHWMRAKTSQAPARKLEFLDILDDLTNRDLLPLQSEYPRRDNQPTEQDQKDVQTTYLYQLMYGKQGTKNVWKQLLEPTIECAHKGCKVCQPGTRDTDKPPEKGTSKYTRNEILKKLSPYMHDPERKERHYQSITVMPVHVYYDSYKQPESPTKLSSQRSVAQSPKKLPTFKEVKGAKRAEWTPSPNAKPMKVVFDSLPKQKEVPPLPLQPTKPTTYSARITSDKSNLKTSTSKSFSPKSFSAFCRNPSPPPSASPIRIDMKEMSKFAKIQKDLEKIKNEAQSKNLNDNEKKIWANKYQKSVGQQLLSFVEHQEPISPPYIPRHAAPKYKDPAAQNNALSPTKDTSPQKLLSNLEGLKQKNCVIQNNIQKAISVIESKMVDLLSAEGNAPNVEAFDVMEKEITGVLSMMKSNKKRPTKAGSAKNVSKDSGNTETSLEEEVNTISNELFKKLEKILDSERSSLHSTRSGQTDISIRPVSKSEEKCIAKKEESKLLPKKEETKHPSKKEVKKPAPIASSRKVKWDTKIQSLPKSSAKNDANSSEDSQTPVKLNAHSASNKPSRYTSKFGKKSKLSTPSSAKSVTHSPAKTWNNILSMPCGDQNTEKPKKQGITHNEHLTDRADPLAEKQKSEVYENFILAKSQGDGALQSQNVTQKCTDDESSQKVSKKVRFEEFLNEDSSAAKSENDSSLLEPSKDDTSSNYYTPNQSPKVAKNDDRDSNTNFVDQVNKIIRRVEDIYTQLDDMHNSSSEDNVKKFKDPVPEVRSEQFLTPFMQAVKEKRQTPEKPGVQKSPSYYNVINFLDSLKDIQDEKPIETHTARLCYHVNVYHQPMVFNQTQIEHTAEVLPILPAKTGCIKKLHDDQGEDQKNKSKKVHFLMSKVDKGNQATICNFHRKKILRISSEQFPPPEDAIDKTEQETEDKTKCDKKDQPDTKVTQSDDSETILANKTDRDTLDKTEETAQRSEDVNLEILNIINKIEALGEEASQLTSQETESCNETQNEKPVQVYCHTINEDPGELAVKDIDAYEKQKKVKMSKIDKSNQSICQNYKDITDESIKAVNTDVSYNARGVNTEEMDTASQSVQSCSNDTSLISLLYDASPEIVCPKVVKEHIDISDGNFGEHSILRSNSLQKLKQNKIVVFREVSEVPNLLRSVKDLDLPGKLNRRRLEKRRGLRLIRKVNLEPVKISKDVQSWGENVVLLKSFYAIVYILMFTALSMDYRCM